MNYYNEHDPKAAAWLRELIRAGEIPPGEVDERSIVDVKPNELSTYIQCHFFAGIGGWAVALKLAGWPDTEPVWTGSCPCQPFSVAGSGLGEKDARHLWPVFAGLIRAAKPPVVFGEQVASKAGREWLAGVFADLEGMDYQRAAADLCAAGVGAPHIRQRLYWVANANGARCSWARPAQPEKRNGDSVAAGSSPTRGLADDAGERRNGGARVQGANGWAVTETSGRLGDTIGGGECGRDERRLGAGGQQVAQQENGAHPANQSGDGCEDALRVGNADVERLTRESLGLVGTGHQAHWLDCDILPCLDGKIRRIESGTFPLADGIQGRVGLLRGYGNAIVPQVACEFISAWLDTSNAPDEPRRKE